MAALLPDVALLAQPLLCVSMVPTVSLVVVMVSAFLLGACIDGRGGKRALGGMPAFLSGPGPRPTPRPAC
jgi:hypothetical protein